MTEPSVAPSGAQHEITVEGHRAVATEVGATLRSYVVDGVDLLDGFERDEISTAGRGQVLAPWPNRLDAGTFAFESHEGHAALDEPAAGNAIHGLVRWLPWAVASRTESDVALVCVVHPQPAYPWRLELGIHYAVAADGLTVTATATNLSPTAAPFGIGFHPYLSVGRRIDEAHLTVPAGRRLITDARGLPTGDEPVAGTGFDFRAPRAIDSTQLDTGYADLTRADDGRAWVEVAPVDGSRVTRLWVDEAFPYLMIYTGDTLEPASRRREGIAVEPMSCPPNALRTGTDLVRLDPGARWSGAWGIAPGDR